MPPGPDADPAAEPDVHLPEPRSGLRDVHLPSRSAPPQEASAQAWTLARGRATADPARSSDHFDLKLDLEPTVAEPVTFGAGPTGGSGAPVQIAAPTGTPAAAMQMAQQAARQMAVSIVPLPEGPVEIKLSPEELGRVRMTVSVIDGAIAVAVQAERVETADLLRRHIETLAREFRDLGYDQSSFSFGGSGTGAPGGSGPGGDGSPDLTEPEATAQGPVPPHPGVATGTGLDLRL